MLWPFQVSRKLLGKGGIWISYDSAVRFRCRTDSNTVDANTSISSHVSTTLIAASNKSTQHTVILQDYWKRFHSITGFHAFLVFFESFSAGFLIIFSKAPVSDSLFACLLSKKQCYCLIMGFSRDESGTYDAFKPYTSFKTFRVSARVLP